MIESVTASGMARAAGCGWGDSWRFERRNLERPEFEERREFREVIMPSLFSLS